ncbi:MAG: helix-turn-helix domain-containing protein [Candidatus Ornithomonoglobus sp.]
MGFSERLQQARLKKGYKQNELSFLIGRSKNTISNYENGISKPNLDDLIKLINLLDVDANFLLYDDLSNNIKNIIDNSGSICDGLNAEGIHKVQSYADDLKSSGKYSKHDTANIGDEIADDITKLMNMRAHTNIK